MVSQSEAVRQLGVALGDVMRMTEEGTLSALRGGWFVLIPTSAVRQDSGCIQVGPA